MVGVAPLSWGFGVGDLHVLEKIAVNAQAALGDLVPTDNHRVVLPQRQFSQYFPGVPSLDLVDPLVSPGKGFFNLEVRYRFDS